MSSFAGQADPAVVAAAQQGDRDALTEIIERHRPWVYNIALRMLGDPGAAEDATQDIFIKVLRRIGSYEGRSKFRTWLYRAEREGPSINEGGESQNMCRTVFGVPSC